jgi:hypothetical protein
MSSSTDSFVFSRQIVEMLEKLVERYSLSKLVLTVLRVNQPGLEFYRRLGFSPDSTSPPQPCYYTILSKSNPRRL